jgi:NADH-quinone oxidoreductase subunit G
VLWYADPLRTAPDRALWASALGAATTVIAHESVMTDTTLTHPDGRLQRLRLAIGRPTPPGAQPGSGVRPAWQVIADLAKAVGLDLRVLAGPMASTQLFEAVPFYAGLTLDEIGGTGVRWPAREAAAAFDAVGHWSLARLDPPRPAPSPNGALRLGTFHSLWTSKEVDVSPALKFLRPHQSVELSPVDAERLGVAPGDQVALGSDGTQVTGPALIRAAVPPGSVFVVEGTRAQPSNLLTEPLVEVRRVGGVATPLPDGAPVIHAPSAEGRSEAPASAPLESPPGTPLSQELNE